MKSKKPKKQRKTFYEKPLHQRQKEVSAHLDKKLAGELGLKAISLRKGDSVKVLRGDFKGKSGKIARIDLSKMRVFVEKIAKKKADGTETLVPLHASNLLLVSMDKSDEKRLKRLKRAKKKTVKEKEEETKKQSGKEKEKEGK